MVDNVKKTGIAWLDYAVPVARFAREQQESNENGDWPTWDELLAKFPIPKDARILTRDGEPVPDSAGVPMNPVRAVFSKAVSRYAPPKGKNARPKKSARPKLGNKFRDALRGINAASGITQGRGSNDIDSELADELAELL